MRLDKTYILLSVIIFCSVIFGSQVYAAGLSWDNHSHPFDFQFGDESFDSHQQSKVGGSKDKLKGFFYIEYTEDTTDGLQNAKHGQETVGWVLDGVPVAGAVLIDNTPGDHPVWCIDPEDMPRSKGYTHFHWLGDENRSEFEEGDVQAGYLLKLTAIDAFYFEHGDSSTAVTPGIDYISHDNIVIDEDNDNCGV